MAHTLLVPLLRGADWWDAYDYPSSIFDQCFGVPILDDDLLAGRYVRGNWVRPRSQANIAASGKSEVKSDDNEFKVVLNVSQFKPEDLHVKVTENFIIINGEHEERADDHGFISRAFSRRYMLPKACDKDNVTSSLDSEGMLTVVAPKVIETAPKTEREVPIAHENKAVKESENSN